MRTLKFIVSGQNLQADPTCDFGGLVPGSEEYVQCEFLFSADWVGYTKAAAFYSPLGTEFSPRLLHDGKHCMIPAEALERREFSVQIAGKKGETKIATNKVVVRQDGGRA